MKYTLLTQFEFLLKCVFHRFDSYEVCIFEWRYDEFVVCVFAFEVGEVGTKTKVNFEVLYPPGFVKSDVMCECSSSCH